MEAIRWDGSALHLIDQRALPTHKRWIKIKTWEAAAQAISEMVVRGAPAIAITAAYGLALAVRSGSDRQKAARVLSSARPTAVNLQWAIDRLSGLSDEQLLNEAIRIHQEDIHICRALGGHGATLIDGGVMTICNTGSLATGGHGTALGIVRSAIELGRDIHVYALETRPYLQGARLTATECLEDDIPCTLIADGMAGFLMSQGKIHSVVVGCDRVATNGDTANKIGTYNLAILARHHKIPFYVAMPTSTLDRTCADGGGIPIEMRPDAELKTIQGVSIAPEPMAVWNPAFDVTPAGLISGWVTECGVWTPPFPPPIDAPSRNR